MSGHSKWATIKHKKGAQDKARGKLFAKLIRQIEVAAREGGGDINANATLRTMFQKARDASVPIDTINRAIKRGTGELEGVRYEAVTYEGYAPGGVAVIVECLTDNRNRTSADVRAAFSKNGGAIAEPGSVAWQFSRRGSVTLSKKYDEDQITMVALSAGADDVIDQGEEWEVVCAPSDLASLKGAFEEAGMECISSDLVLQASNSISIDSEAEARKVLKLIDALDDLDDVQNVYSNVDIPDSVLELVGD
jgi:YebC/PmpR family DNA-binding regulatory protein